MTSITQPQNQPFLAPGEHEDPIGYETLRRMATVARYNDWIFSEIAPHLGQRVLEVGCGIGNMTDYLLDRQVVVGLDLLPASVELTRRRHAEHAQVQVLLGDITDAALQPYLQLCAFDTVICLNVLEHIGDDRTALRYMYEALQPGGHLALFVPAGAYMFGTLDVALGHHRRYDLPNLRRRVSEAGFAIERLGYLNLAGIPGWWLNSRVLKRDLLPAGQLAWFNRLAPLFIRGERLLRRLWDAPAGQSLICIAQRA
ncbi:MAG: class I SAM-dependent methyltransferase [Caldilineales bacterium]|nr:class I SAM-dependent methyltransferase [Caldilineales bacterium]